jgi:hypothetical protein
MGPEVRDDSHLTTPGGHVLKIFGIALLCMFAGGFLGGCASTPTGEAFSTLVEPINGRGLLYVYRVDEYYGKALSFKVVIDGKEKGDVGNGAYMIIPVEPGKHTIEVKGFGYKDEPSEVEAPVGELAFLRVVTKKGFGGLSATLSLEPASRPKALESLAGLKREPERFVDREI